MAAKKGSKGGSGKGPKKPEPAKGKGKQPEKKPAAPAEPEGPTPIVGSRVCRTEVRPLPVQLSDAEIGARGRRMAALAGELDQHRLHAQSVKKDLAKREADLVAEIGKAAAEIRNRFESQDVECQIEQLAENRRRGVVVRTDTRTIVEQRDLYPTELQAELFPKAAGAAPSPDLEQLARECVSNGIGAAEVRTLAEARNVAADALIALVEKEKAKKKGGKVVKLRAVEAPSEAEWKKDGAPPAEAEKAPAKGKAKKDATPSDPVVVPDADQLPPDFDGPGPAPF